MNTHVGTLVWVRSELCQALAKSKYNGKKLQEYPRICKTRIRSCFDYILHHQARQEKSEKRLAIGLMHKSL